MKKLVIIFMLVILGCQSAESKQSLAAKVEPIPSATADAENDHFSAHVFVPEQVEVNESFTIDAELKNITEQAFEITTGDPVFYYIIRDSTGKAMNSITRTDVGIVRTINKEEVILEKHPYRFKNPGIYEISVVAEFTLQDGEGSSKAYKMETVRKKIKAIE